MTLEKLRQKINACKKCRLWQDAKCAVAGEGPNNATLMLVGQNPGAEEDKTGRPFVGRAGKYLNKVLIENGIDRQVVFITNIVKHLTPNNRRPFNDEVEACCPYLQKQLEIIQPETVVLMGKVAWQTPRIGKAEFIETAHPSAALRFTKMNRRFTEDFKRIAKG